MSAEPAKAADTGNSDTGSAGFQPASDKTSRQDAGAPSNSPPAEWHSRGYLPHRDNPGLVQAVTFRLADSLPADSLAKVEDELRHVPAESRATERSRRLAAYLGIKVTAHAILPGRKLAPLSRTRFSISMRTATASSPGA